MTGNRDLRSVRVEVDVDSSGSVDAPAIVVREGASKLAIITGVVGLALAGVLLILALRPDDGPSADPDTAVPAESERLLPLFENTVGAEGLQSTVRASVGFLGLSGRERFQIPPNVVRSANGVDWADVDVSFDDTVALGGTDVALRSYDQLIRTESGYALLMTTAEFQSEGDRYPLRIRIDRLISPNGAIWSIDPAFAPIEASGGTGTFTRVLSHGLGSFVVLIRPPSPVNRALRDLLEANVDDGSSFEEACYAQPMGDGQLFVFPCTEGEALSIDAADTIDPHRFDVLTECALFLSEDWTGDVSFWLVNSGQPATDLAGAHSLLIPPMVTDDGRAVAIDYSGSPRLGPSACDELGVDELPPPAVVIWDPEAATAPVRFPIPDDVELVDLLSVRAEPVVIGRELLLLIGSTVTSIDLDTGEWDEVLTLAFRGDDETSVRFSADGSQLIQLHSARVTVTDLRTGQQRFREDVVGGGNRPGFPSITYADHEVVFAQGGNSVFKVELPSG